MLGFCGLCSTVASNTRTCSPADLPVHSLIHLLNSSTHSPVYPPTPPSLFSPSLLQVSLHLLSFLTSVHLTSIPHIYPLTSIYLLARPSVPSSVHPYILSCVRQASTHTSVHPHICPCLSPLSNHQYLRLTITHSSVHIAPFILSFPRLLTHLSSQHSTCLCTHASPHPSRHTIRPHIPPSAHPPLYSPISASIRSPIH